MGVDFCVCVPPTASSPSACPAALRGCPELPEAGDGCQNPGASLPAARAGLSPKSGFLRGFYTIPASCAADVPPAGQRSRRSRTRCLHLHKHVDSALVSFSFLITVQGLNSSQSGLCSAGINPARIPDLQQGVPGILLLPAGFHTQSWLVFFVFLHLPWLREQGLGRAQSASVARAALGSLLSPL